MMDDYGRQIEGQGKAIDALREHMQNQDRQIVRLDTLVETYGADMRDIKPKIDSIERALAEFKGVRGTIWKAILIACGLSGAVAGLVVFLMGG